MFEASQDSGGSRWPLVRISAHSETEVVCLGTTFLPMTVHWCERTVPCPIENCDLCAYLPARGLFYLAVMCQNRLSILELGALSSSHLEQHCKLLHQGMRAGLVLRLKRGSKKSPVFAEVVSEKSGVQSIDRMTLVARVMALYQMPGPNPAETFEHYGYRCATLSQRRNSQMAERLKAKINGRAESR